MKHWLLFTGYFLLAFCCFGQKEASIWYFGNGAGLDFNAGPPVTLEDTRLNTMEGCAVISSNAGNLLFYTDGLTIWNAQHQVMENGTGLLGDKSSTQSAVIVPQPGSKHIYYVFTVDNVPGTEGVRYSVVDMSQENNAGRIISKNVPLQAPVTEKLTAVKHHNNEDIWVLAHGYNSNIFYAYLVTSAGVINAAQPIMSASGTVHQGNVTNNAIGYMKASPDGKKLALGIRGMRLYELFDFDNNTGNVSNPITFQSADYNTPYGLEFSPDGSKLYINASQNPTANLYQIDLSNNYQTTLIGTSASPYAGALQIGPDGKIYFARYQSKYLGIIHNPNAAGENCRYEDDGLFLGSKTSTFGLPNFIQSYFYQPVFTYKNTCFGSPTAFTLLDTGKESIQKIEWIFDDPVIGTHNISDKIAPTHIFSEPGAYEVSVNIWYKDGSSRKAAQTISIQPAPQVNLGKDTLLCVGSVLKLNAFLPQSSYIWQDGSTNSSFTVTKAGEYKVIVKQGECTFTDIIKVAYKTPLQVNMGRDTVVYKVNHLLLQVNQPGITCIWQDGSQGNTFRVTDSGTYQVEVSDGCETVTDEINITFIPALQLNLGQDQILCKGQNIQLKATQPEATYLWQDGSTQEYITVHEPGMYWVEVSNIYEKLRDSIRIQYIDTPVVSLGKDTTLIPGTTRSYTFTSDANYLWQDGSQAAFYTISKPGLYWVEASNRCGTVRDSIVVSFPAEIPALQLGNDTILCEGNTITLKVNNQIGDITWQNGSNAHYFTVKNAGTYWVEARSNLGIIRDSIQVSYRSIPQVNLGGYAQLCNNEQLVLHAGQQDASASYLWQDSSTQPDLLVNTPGTYWVEVTNACGSMRDSIVVECPACISAMMPNVITPNGDGANDTFVIPCIQEKTWAIEIYNRWGKIVFHSKAYQGEWSGENQDNGIYFYTITNPASKTSLKGMVHVLR
ncbi:T9SS type B sorting domain-containing protein [Rhodocytophaga rosea]|uniref:T9SS type B sorting domain-containing protein n=1 Tax=Rhodocytophaga rosea TaxID=2704465 RepID=A0A6C0GEV0_9BACT|nr:gliding motility-associated C-terminal domain-containing protein [Rhodocytophaga rosea]QHT66293.1 T9SS type B sorting domain-containing protein [Rhodocytophaga rosea]